jgi:hypothetical protein
LKVLASSTKKGSACIVTALAAAGLALCVGCGGTPPAAIGVIGGGVATSKLLDSLEDRATHVLQNAAAAGSLVASKASRDVMLAIDAARQNLHDELDTQWDRLDSQKVSLLRELSAKTEQLEAATGTFGKLGDQLFLDTDVLLSRLPFVKEVPRIRRVDGASQYFRSQGEYRVAITANLFSPFGPETTILVNGVLIQPEWLHSKPPYDVIVALPVTVLNALFHDYQLVYVPLDIKTTVTEQGLFRNRARPATFRVQLELFPRYAASYRLDQAAEGSVVDSSATEIAKGERMTVPGCGDSGCNAYYNVCVNFPVGAQPIGPVNQYDSFSGWGGFGEVSTSASQVCQRYWQHSHNVARNVSIDVAYHPVKKEIQHSLVQLRPIVVDTAEGNTCVASKDAAAQPIIAGMVTQEVGPAESRTVCWLKLGVTYSAEYSQTMKGYTLAIRTFNGENFAATENSTDPAIEIHDTKTTEFLRSTVKLKTPW